MTEEKRLYSSYDIINAIDTYMRDNNICGAELSVKCGYHDDWYNEIKRKMHRGIRPNIFNLEYILSCIGKGLMVTIELDNVTVFVPINDIYKAMEEIRQKKHLNKVNIAVKGKLNSCKYDRIIRADKNDGFLSMLKDKFMDGVAEAMGYKYFYTIRDLG